MQYWALSSCHLLLLTPLPYRCDHCAGKWGKTWSLGSWPLQKIKSRATPPHSKWPLTLANKLRQMLLSSFLLSCPPFAKLTDQHYPFILQVVYDQNQYLGLDSKLKHKLADTFGPTPNPWSTDFYVFCLPHWPKFQIFLIYAFIGCP